MTVEDSGDSDGVLTVQPKPAAAVQRKWKKADLSVTWDPANIPSRSLSCSADPVNLFEIFFDDEVCSFLAQMTEEYAHNTHGCHDFSVDVADMRCFIAILLLSGYVDVPRWRMLWEVGSETYNPAVAQAMRRNRFDTIKHYLHCSDNSQLTPGDKFAKVRPLMSMLNERFLNVAQLEEHLCVDESMVPYYGRHGAKQFLKGKPIRFGYKFWCLCTRLGYVIQCEPYQGAGYMTYDKDLGLGASVVLDIVSELPQGCGFKLFGDRFFSSLKLVDQLKKKGIGYTGTVMSNRVERCPLSSSKEMTKKPRGSYDYLLDTTTDTLVVVWNDSCPVHLVSNVYGVNPVQACTRWISTTKKKESISQPSVVHMYNKYMGGVDRMDQNVGNYRVGIRSKKWWWPVFVFCLDTSLHNAWQAGSCTVRPLRGRLKVLTTFSFVEKWCRHTSRSTAKEIQQRDGLEAANHWRVEYQMLLGLTRRRTGLFLRNRTDVLSVGKTRPRSVRSVVSISMMRASETSTLSEW